MDTNKEGRKEIRDSRQTERTKERGREERRKGDMSMN